MSGGAPLRRGNLGLGVLMGVILGLMVVGLLWVVTTSGADEGPVHRLPAATASASAQAPTRTPTPVRTPTPTPSGVVTSLPAGEYVTVLDSLPKSSTTPEVALAIAFALSTDEHRAVVVDTDRIRGLNGGYYAVVVPHASTREEAEQVCLDLDLEVGTACYPRRVAG